MTSTVRTSTSSSASKRQATSKTLSKAKGSIKESEATAYSAKDIEVLEGLEPVRQRPGMYIGGTDGVHGLHHLVKEILDNAVDEAMNGHANKISVTLHSDRSSITIEDNGRGIPVDLHPKFKKSALELILTTLHAGGKFSDHNYTSAGGLHGVGASVVNALSEELIATVSRDGFVWSQAFARGKPRGTLRRGEKTKNHGTKIFFRPDKEIFRSTRFSPELLERLIQEKAFLNKGLSLAFFIEGEDNSDALTRKQFCYPDGLSSYLTAYLDENKLAPLSEETFILERSDGIRVEVAFCWTESTQEKILSFANGIRTGSGGTHEDAFKNGLVKAVRNYLTVHNLIPKGIKIVGEDIREGLVGLLSVNVPGSVAQLQFQGQTKDKLNNIEVVQPVETLIKSFENTLNSRPSVAAIVCERIVIAARARMAARSASQSVSRKIGISHRLNLPGKLADCSSTNPGASELFIVEGDSAGGSAKQGRDRKTQAVLPLRGKVLNSIMLGEDKIKDNAELMDLVSALGCGFGRNIRVDKLRYSKVIILTDADADGMHIATLLMAFFFRFMRDLVNSGHLFLGLAPLFRIRVREGGKEVDYWAASDDEKDKLLGKLAGRSKPIVTRFKGLGEMNPQTLWETTLNPRTRNMLRIRIEDEAHVMATMQSLLGKDSSERYRLIQEYAPRLEVDV